MGVTKYRALPWVDLTQGFKINPSRVIYEVPYQYKNKEGRRPVWMTPPSIHLGREIVNRADGTYREAYAKPGELFTRDFFAIDRFGNEAEKHETLTRLETEGRIIPVGHVDENGIPKMLTEYDDAFYRVYEYAAGFLVDSRNHGTAVQSLEELPLYVVKPGQSYYVGQTCVQYPGLIPQSGLGPEWLAGSLDEQRDEAKKNAASLLASGVIKEVGTCSGGGRLNVLSGGTERYCIEFTDDEAKAVFFDLAVKKYFEWLENKR